MLWREPLDEILGSRAKIRILRALWRSDGDALSGREIARRIGLSHTGVMRALEQLEEQDVVWPSSDPTGTRYRLNRTHQFVNEGLMPLFGIEASLYDRVRDFVLEAVPDAVSVVIFGSVARGQDAPDSDLDVLVVIPDGSDSLDAGDCIHGVEFYAKLGKVLVPIIWTRSELADAVERDLPLMGNIKREGIVVFGEPLMSARSPLAEGVR
jgi:predicted nucleotidyltransferase